MLTREMWRGKRVRLTAMEDGDIPAVAKWFQEEFFLRHLDAVQITPMNEAKVRKMIEDSQSSSRGVLFAVRTLEGDELVGMVELDGILWNQGGVGLAVGIAPGQRGQGYGREAMEMLLDYAFSELNMRRVGLTVFEYNEPAIALYEKIGFTREGAAREYLHRDGKTFDLFYYGLLRREWEARR